MAFVDPRRMCKLRSIAEDSILSTGCSRSVRSRKNKKTLGMMLEGTSGLIFLGYLCELDLGGTVMSADAPKVLGEARCR